jgi:hypothetical protein
MTYLCTTCGITIPPSTKPGRKPKRCHNCRPPKASKQQERKCETCGALVRRTKPTGAIPRMCAVCVKPHLSRLRKQSHVRAKSRHSLLCQQCGRKFSSDKKQQRFCCLACSRLARRIRVLLICANASCKKAFEATPSQIASGTRCCSWQCRSQHQTLAPRLCQNPECGKPISRVRSGPKHDKYGKDSGKYCCVPCYQDHRWGSNRPRLPRSPKVRQAASSAALRTSLRTKCKLLGVPYDPECTRRAVCERDGFVCQLCRIKCLARWTFDKVTRKIDPRSPEHDHIVPLTADGSPGNVFGNSQCLCHECNFRKRDTAKGQLRLDLEGSVMRWEEGGLARNRRRSRLSAATPDAGRSTTKSQSQQPMAL